MKYITALIKYHMRIILTALYVVWVMYILRRIEKSPRFFLSYELLFVACSFQMVPNCHVVNVKCLRYFRQHEPAEITVQNFQYDLIYIWGGLSKRIFNFLVFSNVLYIVSRLSKFFFVTYCLEPSTDSKQLSWDNNLSYGNKTVFAVWWMQYVSRSLDLLFKI